MSSHIRSLEDAAEHIINTLKHFLKVETLFVTSTDGIGSRIIRAFNRHEDWIHNNSQFPLLQSYCNLVLEQASPVLSIPNTLEDNRTSSFPITELLGACSFIGIAIRTTDNQSFGTICALNKEPVHLDERQLGFLESMAAFFRYIIELENASVTDSLTGLYNRRYLSHLYHNSTDKQFSVMFIDIDDFKEVNDSYGHDIGDLLLHQIASRLKQSVRKTDILVRYGGDEFIICFQHLVDNHDIEFVAGKIKDSINRPFNINGHTLRISASIGISSVQGVSSSLKELICDADKAMYGIKHNEKNL